MKVTETINYWWKERVPMKKPKDVSRSNNYENYVIKKAHKIITSVWSKDISLYYINRYIFCTDIYIYNR